MTPPFAARVVEGLKRSGMTMRQLCRAVDIDPSFFSKVLAGKRSPPAEEAVLRAIAAKLGVDAAELVVAAGRIPQEWSGLWRDPELFGRINSLATAGSSSASTRAALPAASPVRYSQSVRPLSEELL